jgi:hypothetical protein
MTGILGGFGGQLGKDLAVRWLGLLALPGALFLAVMTTAVALGQAHALDAAQLVRQITEWARDPAVDTVGGQIVLLVAALAMSVGAGLAARVLGAAIERLVLAAGWVSWPSPLRALVLDRIRARQQRWDQAHRAYSARWVEAAHAKALKCEVDPQARHAALRARNSVATERPDRPTWSGDRIHGVSVRLHRDHRLDLTLLWPHLWLTLPDQERTEITAARTGMTRASELGAWAVLYLPLIYWWWPAAVIAALLGLTAWARTRSTTDGYAQLVEAAVRLHSRDLARQLGLDYDGPLAADAGDRFDELLNSTPPAVESHDRDFGTR